MPNFFIVVRSHSLVCILVYLDDPIFEVYELLPKFFASKHPLALISKDCFLAIFTGFFKVINKCKCCF